MVDMEGLHNSLNHNHQDQIQAQAQVQQAQIVQHSLILLQVQLQQAQELQVELLMATIKEVLGTMVLLILKLQPMLMQM